MNADYFRFMFAYTYWAWHRVLDQVAEISQDEYVAQRMLDRGTIRNNVLHAMAGERRQLAMWDDEPVQPNVDEETLPTVAALRAVWVEQEKKMEAFLARLTDDGCTREIKQISRQSGQETETPLWVLMAQIVNHHTQHRSEVALHVTQLGHSPGDLDVTRYFRERGV